MLGELVLLVAILVGVVFAGQLRRGDPGQRGYVLVLATVLVLAVLAALRADRFLSIVAVSLGALVVVVPWLLDVAVRAAFGRERLALAVRLAGLRATLMLGAGLGRQQAILRGLAVLERQGVDGALSYFRTLAHETEDDTELRIIHEQIVSMLLFGQRWNEGIAHYEARFPPDYAAGRPPLALGLLRAYGEAGRLSHAASLLRAVEELLGRDPRAAGVVSQARLTFLAYAGQAEPVAAALTDERRRRLGLSAASGALFRGIALARAGRADAAEAELRRVADLAGSRDGRVVHASRKAMADAPEPALPLPPELHGYAERVADRLEGFLAVAPAVRRVGSLWITPGLLLLLGTGYVVGQLLDGGGAGLVRLGAAMPELLQAGSWGRLLTGMLVQTEPIGLLLTVYAVWLAGPLVERVAGRGPTLVGSLGAGALGLWVASRLAEDPAVVLGGGALLATGLLCGALAVLLAPRTSLPRRTRRVLALPLLLLLLALAVTIPREGAGLHVSGVGMGAAAMAGALSTSLATWRWCAAVLRVIGFGLVLCLPVALLQVGLEDPQAFELEHRRSLTAQGVVLSVPARFEVLTEPRERPAGAPWRLEPGLHDTLAQRVGDRVQVLVTPTGPESQSDSRSHSALLRVNPDLRRALVDVEAPAPPGFQEAYERASARAGIDPATLRSTIVRGDGIDVGIVLERPLPGGISVVLIAAPPSALDHDAALYAAMIADAVPPPAGP
ncbi:rhomboid family intramembrane serine protease [Paraliomyxa miuraensis]|uniref:rhomboid family intramembrane serine protease n=1 Tax=Paraliomyxa miuraensis TaxID=376150 RepID=UPI0022529CA2|nr:rhomboid family intramembrane serine protease [Paraliomyxa miuraensis]MCX4245902.1 hypothetical protein [Paraliomyxa miuraensis]